MKKSYPSTNVTNIIRYLLSLPGVLLLLLTLVSHARTQQPGFPKSAIPLHGRWTLTGSMQTARAIHTATVLPDGTVLVTGGYAGGGVALASSELYNPNAGTWSPTGSLATARYYHTATLLLNGTILVTGGYDASQFSVYASAEIYDPATGTWSATRSLKCTTRLLERGL